MKRQKSVQPPLGIARPTARPTSWRGPSEVYAVRARRLAAERRADAERELFPIASPEILAIFAKAIKRITPLRTWVKVDGHWQRRTL